MSLLSGDLFDEILGEDVSEQNNSPSKNNLKKKTKSNLIKPEVSQNEIDVTINNESLKPTNNLSSEEDEEESDGILDILNGT